MMSLTSDHEVEILRTRNLTGLELTHSSIPFEFSDNNQGLSLLVQKIEAVFVFFCQSSSQTFWSGHIPFSASYGVNFARNERIVETRHCLLNFLESLVQTRFSQIELAFNPYIWLALQRRLLAHHWSFHAHKVWPCCVQWCQGIYCRQIVTIYVSTSI